MSQVNDCRFDACRALGYTGQINDMLLQWAHGEGAPSTEKDVNLAVRSALHIAGATSGDLSDAWFEALREAGYTGSRQEMWKQFWCVDGGSFAAFNMALTHSLTAGKGEFKTFSRNSIATITDYEGLVKETQVDEARFYGSNRTENLFSNYQPNGTATVTQRRSPTSQHVEAVAAGFDALGNTQRLQAFSLAGVTEGKHVISFDMKAELPADIGKNVRFVLWNSGGSLGTVYEVALTEDYVRYSTEAVTWDGTPGNNVYLWVYGGFSNEASGCVVSKCMIENVAGQVNEAPADYVSMRDRTSTAMQIANLNSDTSKYVAGGTNAIAYDAVEDAITITGDGSSTVGFAAYLINSSNPEITQTDNRPEDEDIVIVTFYAKGTGGNMSMTLFDITGLETLTVVGDGVWRYYRLRGRYNAVSATLRIYGASWAAGEKMWIKDIDIGIADHGSHVDAVKYENIVHRNSVIAGVVTPPTDNGTEDIDQVQEPGFDSDVGEWTLGTGWEISGGKLNALIGSTLASFDTIIVGVWVRFQFTVENASLSSISLPGLTITPFTSTGLEFALQPGTHDFIHRITSSGFFRFQADGAALVAIDNCQITPLKTIPADYLKGVLIEDQATNIQGDSENFDQATSAYWVSGSTAVVTTNAAVAPDGTLTADNISDNSAATWLTIVSVGHSGLSTPRTAVSVYVKKDNVSKTTRFCGLRSIFNGGTTTTLDLTFATDTGETNSKVVAGSGLVVDHGSVDCGDYWRFWYICDDNGQLNTSVTHQFYPAIGANADLITYSSSITGSVDMWGWQTEVGSGATNGHPTSYISTAGIASATRIADVLQYDFPTQLDVPPANDAEYSFALTVTPQDNKIAGVGYNQTTLMLGDSATAPVNMARTYWGTGSSNHTWQSVHQGTPGVYVAVTNSKSAFTPFRWVGRYNTTLNKTACSENGSAIVTSVPNQSTPPDWDLAAKRIEIGAFSPGVQMADSCYKNIKIWARPLTDAQMIAESTL